MSISFEVIANSFASRNPAFCCAAFLGMLFTGSPSQVEAQVRPALLGSPAWYQISRTAVNPTTGKGFGYGYYTEIAGLPGPFFSGAPSESTAYFTYRTSVFQIVPVKANGDVNSVIVGADTFDVYLNTSPNRDWNNPDSFSTGVIVATFTRAQFLLPRIWESHGTEYLTLNSSTNFTFNNVTANFENIFTTATMMSSFSNAPLTGQPGFPGVTASAGCAIVSTSGAPLSQKTDPPQSLQP